MTFDPTLLLSAADPAASLLIGASTLLKITKVLAMVLFVISAILLIAVVLLQEGKGGGIAGAFGGAAAESFGVKAGTVNRFTTILASVFMGLALVHASITSAMGDSVIRAAAPKPELPPISMPSDPLPPTTPPPTDPTPPVTPPAMNGAPMDGGTPPSDAPPAVPPVVPPAMGDVPPTPPEVPPGPPPDAPKDPPQDPK